MAESTMLEYLSTAKKEQQCTCFKAKVLEDHKVDDTSHNLKKAIAGEQTIVFTDKSTSYVDIADYVELQNSEKSNEQTTKEILADIT